jgi:hypothetical protein
MEKNGIRAKNIINLNEEIIETLEQRKDISQGGLIIDIIFYIREM